MLIESYHRASCIAFQRIRRLRCGAVLASLAIAACAPSLETSEEAPGLVQSALEQMLTVTSVTYGNQQAANPATNS